ncbi:9440_t:CDS:10 [Acaulospora colombiana]|uniref:9440_t:CDS:1 n=1 Tax=Acaulospora colombiana TaxID=27376 RepID=A0ACA9MJN9_9GLOM|nr:9440_t:CDS:10 [Acaulospora colombiana]
MANFSGNGQNGYDDWGGLYPPEARNEKNDSFREMEAVMKQISQDWEEMMAEDVCNQEFNPVPLSLQLLDDSSLGKDYKVFQRTKKSLDRALQFIVNGTTIRDLIVRLARSEGSCKISEERVREMKTKLKVCKEALTSKRSDLLQLWFRSQQYKEMIRILDLIEEFKGTPEKLEVLLREKHFLTASRLLLESIHTLERKEMMGIGALSDLRRYLRAQQSSLHELLIEELHNHLYVKSAYCDSRWVKYAKDQTELPSPLMEWSSEREIRKMNFMSNVRNKKSLHVNTSFPLNTPLSPKSPRPFNISIFDEEEVITENLNINPETDSFYYMEIILESLAILGRLPQALKTIIQRIPIELYQLVDKTVAEVEERNAHVVSTVNTKKSNNLIDMFSLESPENDAPMEVLRDLLWTLYSKLDAVLQGHRFILDIVERISKRPEFTKITHEPQKIRVYQFAEIWKPVQSEVRTLLRDYITDDERESMTINVPEASIQDSITEKKPRDISKQLFRFGDVDGASNTDLDKHYDSDIKSYLQNSLPELFSKVPDERQLSVFVVDRFANTNITAGHRLVIKPDAFNVTTLFKPTLAFLEKVKIIIPPSDDGTSADFTTFLDDFVVNVFLPQIGDKIFDLFQKATNDAGAFQEDPSYKSFANFPVVKSTSALIMLVETIVTKNSAESDEVETGNLQGVSATWVQQDQLSEVLSQYPYQVDDADKNRKKRRMLCEKETRVEMNLKKNRFIRFGELIYESKKLTSLGLLYHSLKWFNAKIWEMRGRGSKLAASNANKMDDNGLGNYQLDYEAYEPDPYVVTLNAEMVKFDEFVFEGLDALMEHVLIYNSVYIRNLNSNGVMKMTRNILALQQNLRNIVDRPGEISMDRARQYYDLFNIGPANMLEQIRERGSVFSLEDYKTMLEIMYKIDPNEVQQGTSKRDSPSSNRRLYNDQLLELHELMIDSL